MVKTSNFRNVDDDTGLVSACRKGDLNAFESLVMRYQGKMFNIAFRITGDPDDACETVQDAFLAVYRNMGRFRGDSAFSTWITSITVNHAKNRLKKANGMRRNETCSLDDPIRLNDGCIDREPPSNTASAHEELEKREIMENVWQCIKKLDNDSRQVLVLRDMQDFSYEEIAGILKLALGTVKSRLSRARETVRNCLKGKLGDLV